MGHEQDGTLGAFAFPVEKQVSLQLGFVQMTMHQWEQILHDLMQVKEVLTAGTGNGGAAYHGGKLFGIKLLPGRIGVRGVISLAAGTEQCADERHQQQQNKDSKQEQQGIYNDFHFTDTSCFLWKRYATPMAMAPLGRIMKLVEPVKEGTRINKTVRTVRGRAAIFILPR